MSNETTKSRPTHRIYSVTKTGTDKKGFWSQIGAAWPHRDGKGFNLKFTASPYGDNEIVIRVASARTGSAQ